MAFLAAAAVESLGFKKIGKGVLISDKCSIYGAANMSFGDNVRVDDFSYLSASGDGFIELGSHIHIAAHSMLLGAGGITMQDFSGLSSYVAIYSATDDYGGDYLIGPVMDPSCLNIIKNHTIIERYSTVGTHSSLLPGAAMREGSILGAHSFTTKELLPWTIYGGTPAVKIRDRKKGLLEQAQRMRGLWQK